MHLIKIYYNFIEIRKINLDSVHVGSMRKIHIKNMQMDIVSYEKVQFSYHLTRQTNGGEKTSKKY